MTTNLKDTLKAAKQITKEVKVEDMTQEKDSIDNNK